MCVYERCVFLFSQHSPVSGMLCSCLCVSIVFVQSSAEQEVKLEAAESCDQLNVRRASSQDEGTPFTSQHKLTHIDPIKHCFSSNISNHYVSL